MKRLKDFIYESLILEEKSLTPLENFVLDIKDTDFNDKTIKFLLNDKTYYFNEFNEENISDEENKLIVTLTDEENEKGQSDVLSLFNDMKNNKYADTDYITFIINGKSFYYNKIKVSSNDINICLVIEKPEYKEKTDDSALQSPEQNNDENTTGDENQQNTNQNSV